MTMLDTIDRAAVRDIAAGLNAEQARWLVDYYYAIQDYRIQATGQERAVMQEADEHAGLELVGWLATQTKSIEDEVKRALDAFSDSRVPGRWAKSITGIGPVLAAGLLAHIDIERAPTAGHIWRFAGLDPTSVWEKGQKRPYNARLKVLCWKIGDSFVKFKSNPKDVYGKVYAKRKELEVERNEAGLFADQAAEKLERFKIRDKATRAVYEAGKLPAGRLDLRARRYAVKLFLSHYQWVSHVNHFGKEPPIPYILTQPDHVHFIAPPNWPLEE
jgi:hypothetical protein